MFWLEDETFVWLNEWWPLWMPRGSDWRGGRSEKCSWLRKCWEWLINKKQMSRHFTSQQLTSFLSSAHETPILWLWCTKSLNFTQMFLLPVLPNKSESVACTVCSLRAPLHNADIPEQPGSVSAACCLIHARYKMQSKNSTVYQQHPETLPTSAEGKQFQDVATWWISSPPSSLNPWWTCNARCLLVFWRNYIQVLYLLARILLSASHNSNI